MSNESANIEISRDRYIQLLDGWSKLNALENAGVDGWSGYDSALAEYFREKEYDEAVRDFADEILELASEYGHVDYPAGREAGPRIYFEEDVTNSIMSRIRAFVLKHRN